MSINSKESQSKLIKVSDFLISELANIGVKEIFFLPGGGSMHLNDSLFNEKRIKPILCQHEQACGISAEANGRTNSVGFGVALVTSGPGATNILTPAVGAWVESIPMLIISGQVKTNHLIKNRKIRQGGVQEVDIISMVKSKANFAKTLVDLNTIRSDFEEAIYLMRNGRPGPVWLDVPLDIQGSFIKIDPQKKLFFRKKNKYKIPVKKIISSISLSKRPVLLIGHGVRISGAKNEFLEFIKKYKIPCLFTWNAMDLLPYEHSLNMGRPGVVASRASNFTIQNCDLLISVGSSLDNIITAFNPLDFAREAKKIIVDIDENEIKNNPMEINTSVISDAKKFFEELNSLGKSKEKYIAWLRKCRDWKLRYGINQNRVENNSLNINHYELINTLSEIIPKNSLIATGSSGLAIEIFYTSFTNKINQRIFLTSGIGAMGYGISSAIGACIGIGKKRTICIESDGSIMLNIQELTTLKSYNLPIIIIILNNKGYASIRNTQQNYFNGRFIGTGEDSGLKIPEFTKIAKSYNINSRKITSIKSLKSIFSKIKKINEPLILDVILDKNEILAPKVSAITNSDGSIFSMPLEDMSPLLPLKVLQEEMLIPLLESSLNANRNEK